MTDIKESSCHFDWYLINIGISKSVLYSGKKLQKMKTSTVKK